MQHPVDTSRREDPLTTNATSFVARLATNLAVQDVVIAVYLTLLMGAVLTATGPDRDASIRTVIIDAFFFVVGIMLTRGGILRHASFANALVYRLTVFFPVFLSYFQLRWILPAVSPHSASRPAAAPSLQ